MCDVHTKTAVLNALLLTRFIASPHLRCQFQASYFKPKGGFPDPKGSYACLPTQEITLTNKVVEKAIMEKAIVDKGLGKKCGQYRCFIFMA